MASMKYHKDVKRWRVFWHVTLPNGEVDKGSKAFKDKVLAQEFKEHCEKRAKQIKKTVFVETVFLENLREPFPGVWVIYASVILPKVRQCVNDGLKKAKKSSNRACTILLFAKKI